MNLDKKAQALIAEKPNLMVPWLLMASYLYYHNNESMFSDDYYDALSKELLLKWDEIEHSDKHLITKDDLMAGSLYKLKELDYPSMCRAGALFLARELKE
jgi:hypothetical protein